MKKNLCVASVLVTLMACNIGRYERDGDQDCVLNTEIEGGHLGAGAYPAPDTSFGAECYCVMSNATSDEVRLDYLQFSGETGLPAIVNVDITNLAFSSKVPLAGSGRDGTSVWVADFSNQLTTEAMDYSGVWAGYLSMDDLSDPETFSCEANPYQPIFYWEETHFDPKGRSVPAETRSYSCPANLPYHGDFLLSSLPGAPTRGDGSVAAFFFLEDGDPRINGLKPSRFTVLDPGDAVAIEIEGKRYELKAGVQIPLPAKAELWQKMYVTYAAGGTTVPTVALDAQCSAPVYSTVRTPTYAVPSLLGTVFGVDQPGVVQVITEGNSRHLSLLALGTGYSRGLRLAADGSFAREGAADGLTLRGKVLRQDAQGLVVRFDTLQLEGVSLLPSGTSLTFKPAG